MQYLSWDNYRYVLAVYRAQSISGAARTLAVNETTVSRRLVQIESFLQCKLFSRRSTGMIATEAGQRLIDRIERVKAELDQAVAEITDTRGAVAGPIRIATDAMIMNHVLVPNLSGLLERYPALECELICVDGSDRLRDADISIHCSPDPDIAGNEENHLGELAFGVFVSRQQMEFGAEKLIPWISLTGDNFACHGHSGANPMSAKSDCANRRVTVDRYDTLLSCVHSGLGKCSLPLGIGLRDPLLALLDEPADVHRRNLIQTHQPELSGTARLDACAAWLHESLHRFNQFSGVAAA